jgi:hypothetical protein
MGISIPNDDEFPEHTDHPDVAPEFKERNSSPEDFNEDLDPDDEETN